MSDVMKRMVFVVALITLFMCGTCIAYAQQVPQGDIIITLDEQAVRTEAPGLENGEKQEERESKGKLESGPKEESEGELKSGPKGESEGESCGVFDITGYCGCQICTGDNHLTYSGTAPRTGHTVSADLNRFPLGTRLRIGGYVYTVEDTGASVETNEIDIYFDTHEEASEWGRQQMEVFLVE